ncbi:FAD-binding oxidoreductase [Nocardioides terrisoli]|uniref:FAD-binding oxidoreductase n=1 Tax=Nocardioides terrisoli TaxID=3388267 RepID=UPI00287BC88A|nr:FAD-binding oxidoreductase [Nocardioides marmorisolisilvae]
MTTIDLPPSGDGLAGVPDPDVSGPLLRPDSAGWSAEVSGFNTAVVHHPALVVGAMSAQDVRAAVIYAASRHLAVSVHATGHGASAAVEAGILISTRRMDQVVVDPRARTARVGAGVRMRALIDAAAPHGLAPLVGSSSDVSVVGFTLGGGLPVTGRAHGYGADHVRSVEVVTMDGRLREVDADHEPDLFWGLRGGKGNLGIVTAITVDLLPITTVYGGGIFWAEEHLPAVLDAYRAWSADLPETCCTSVAALRLPPLPDIPEPLRGRTLAHLRVCHLGDEAEGRDLVAAMRRVGPAVVDAVDTMPYAEVDSIHRDPDHPVPFFERSALLRDLTPDTVTALLGRVGPGVTSPLLMGELRQLGGALGRPPAVPNAVGGRDAAYSLVAIAVLAGPAADSGPAAADALMAAAAPWSTGQTLLNMHGRPAGEVDRARAWDPEGHRRLGELRRRYDPAGLLQAGHVIGVPAASAAATKTPR